MHNSFIAILAAGVAGWLFGAVWYTALGRPYQQALGVNPDDCKGKPMPKAPLVVAFLAALVMSAVLYQLLTNLGVLGVASSAIAGATIGLGFLLTSILVNNMFQQKPWALTAIDAGHWVLAVTIEAAVIALLA
jgi:Protein of unknown function (DUF1761)